MFNTCLRDVLIHFAGTEMNLKTKVLILLVATQSKFMGFQSLHNSFVEVSDESCHKQEYSILCHERFWQSIPAKAIVHVIEDAFLATTKIVDCSIIEKIPPKGVSFSDFICIFAMPFRILFVFILQH